MNYKPEEFRTISAKQNLEKKKKYGGKKDKKFIAEESTSLGKTENDAKC
jgi:hypothetical protein